MPIVTDTSQVNTALLTITLMVVGVLSFVMRQLLTNIQISLAGVQYSLNTLLIGQGSAVAAVREAIGDTSTQTYERLDRLTRAVELAARADMLRIIATPNMPAEVKEQAKAIVNEIAEAHQ